MKTIVHERMYHHGIIDKREMLEPIVSNTDPVATSEKGSVPRALKIAEKMTIEKIPIKRMMPKNVPSARPSDEVLSKLPMTNTPVNIITGIARNTKIFLLSGFKNPFQSIYFIRLVCLYCCRRRSSRAFLNCQKQKKIISHTNRLIYYLATGTEIKLI